MCLMDKLEYWIEAVEFALEDIGKVNILSREDLKIFAQSIVTSADQESMAYGSCVADNPLINEIEKLNEKHKIEMDKMEKRELIFRKNVADRHGPNVSEKDVYIEHGSVYYDYKGL